MSVNLQKGQKVNLTKGGVGLKNVMVGLGWDEVERKRGFFAPKPEEIDCDASCILLGSNGKLVTGQIEGSCVYFGALRHSSGAVVHQGDNLTGGGDGDDEQIMVDIPAIPANVERLVFVVNIYDANKKNQHFGMIKNAFIRVVDMSKNTELCRFDLSEDYSGMTGMIVGEIYRSSGEWKFNAIGQGVRDASRLGMIVNMYK